MDIRTIQYFLEVAKECNITRAAENLHMAQPPLSRQMRQLEEELGVELFDRSKKRLKLTEEGVLLRNRGEEILSMIDKTREEVSEPEKWYRRYTVYRYCGGTGTESSGTVDFFVYRAVSTGAL